MDPAIENRKIVNEKKCATYFIKKFFINYNNIVSLLMFVAHAKYTVPAVISYETVEALKFKLF